MNSWTQWTPRLFLGALTACVLVLVPYDNGTADTELERAMRATLKGLTAVYVLVEDMKQDAAQAGLSKTTLQTDVELHLLKSGIKTVDFEEHLSLPGKPLLYLNVGTLQNRGFWIYSISLSFRQTVALERTSGVKILAETWRTPGGIGMTPQLSDIRDRVRDHVDKFIHAWLSVNPK